MSVDLVLFEPVRSAEPPIVSLITLFTAFSVNSLDFRVAIVGDAALFSFLNFRMTVPVSYTHLRAHET